MDITVKVQPTGHPDVEPWEAEVFIDDIAVGAGTPEKCEALASELRGSHEKTECVLLSFIDNHNQR